MNYQVYRKAESGNIFYYTLLVNYHPTLKQATEFAQDLYSRFPDHYPTPFIVTHLFAPPLNLTAKQGWDYALQVVVGGEAMYVNRESPF